MKNLFKVLILILTLLSASSTFATAKNQMIMITDKNCIFCIAWEKEIGEIYPKSDIGKKYPINIYVLIRCLLYPVFFEIFLNNQAFFVM